jgi:uncharacterized coiled-coil protein SlyX
LAAQEQRLAGQEERIAGQARQLEALQQHLAAMMELDRSLRASLAPQAGKTAPDDKL